MNRRIFTAKAGGLLGVITGAMGIKATASQSDGAPGVSGAVQSKRLPDFEVPFAIPESGCVLTDANGVRYENFRIFVGGRNDHWSVKWDQVGTDGKVSWSGITVMCADEHRESCGKMFPRSMK